MTTEFTWGAAAASYQIEGRLPDDGRGKCVWDMFCEQPGKTRGGHNGQTACMHVRDYQQDVALMQSLNLQAYRFSISWPRVLPDGIGKLNRQGLGFYDQLVDELMSRNITPWATLFHWDYPYALYLKGGWLNPDSPKWFADYAGTIVDALSDRVRHWITLNEPQCIFHFGHHTGYMAPGLQLGTRELLTAAHNGLLAHGLAVQQIRSRAKQSPTIGVAPVGHITVPGGTSAEEIDFARQTTFAITQQDCWNNTWFADPMILGGYPEDGLALFGKACPDFSAQDMDTICQPLDFYGTNIYTAERVGFHQGQLGPLAPAPGEAYSAMDWLVEPTSLYWACRFFHERYQLPLVITENGMACHDWPDSQGHVQDPQRIQYLDAHIQQVLKAREDGARVDGYFVWSILDNFEWALGYDRRFGLVYVDYASQKRTPKASALWYRDFIASHS